MGQGSGLEAAGEVLRIGALVKVNVRRVFFEVPKHYPKKGLFAEVLANLRRPVPSCRLAVAGLAGSRRHPALRPGFMGILVSNGKSRSKNAVGSCVNDRFLQSRRRGALND